MYLAHMRPYLTYLLNIISQFMHNPGKEHVNLVMCILKYMKATPRKWILFTKNVDCQVVDTYTNAS